MPLSVAAARVGQSRTTDEMKKKTKPSIKTYALCHDKMLREEKRKRRKRRKAMWLYSETRWGWWIGEAGMSRGVEKGPDKGMASGVGN